MKRIVLKSPREFAVEEVATPSPGRGEAIVRIGKVGVCGSDMHLFRLGRIGDIRMTQPLVIGHEAMGTVDAAGEGVDASLVGRRVAIEPQDYCGRCRWCVAGLQNLCPQHAFLGLPPRDGAMQEYLAHPAHLLEPLPDSISDDAAVGLEPMSIALHAIRLVKIRPGLRVCILGTGVLGTCVLTLLSLYRGVRIVCVDQLHERLERALILGAAAAIEAAPGSTEATADEAREALGGFGADVVFECAGVADTLYNMAEVAAPGAHVAVIGSNPAGPVAFSSSSARRKGLTIRFVRRSLNTLGPVLDLAERGEIDPAAIVTHAFPASQAARAFDVVDTYADGVLKAVIDMREW